jgi:DNA polymerase-3 subunit delta'
VSAPTVSDISPDLFTEVIGQDRAVAQLRAAAMSPVHAYLFVGPPGSGRRVAARAFAAALLAPPGAGRDDRSAHLALDGHHPDVLEVEREGASISTKQADDIIRAAFLSPLEGERKVLILDEFHLMTAAVAPKLLKTIEEPPPSTVFVVLADDVPPELVTIASRCVRIDFGPVPEALVESTLQAEGADPADARLAAAAAGGDLDRARLLVEDSSGLAARRAAWHEIPRRLDGTGATVFTIVAELFELIDEAAEKLKARQKIDEAALEERIKEMGERGSGRKDLEDRHKRELRRHRTDEIRFGLATLAGAYRDRLVAGGGREDALAVARIHVLLDEWLRNPNESLQLQALLLQLPGWPLVPTSPTEVRKRRTLAADSALHIETTSVECARSRRVSTGASRRCWARTKGPKSRPRRWRSTSFTRSSVRMSRTCSTGVASQRSTTRVPVGVAATSVREGALPFSTPRGTASFAASSRSIARYTSGRLSDHTEPTSPSVASSLTIAHPCVGFSRSRASVTHSPRARSGSGAVAMARV